MPVSCYAQINPDVEAFIFRVLVPVRIAAEQRPLLSEFLQRVNYGHPVGSWAIDLDTGDTRFKNGIYFQGGELGAFLIRNVIESALVFVHHDMPGLLKLQQGGTVAEALAARDEDERR